MAHLENVRVEGFDSLVTEFAQSLGASAMVKGLRAISDFDYEFQMAQLNRHLAADVETVYLPASPKYSFVSSSGVREVAAWGARSTTGSPHTWPRLCGPGASPAPARSPRRVRWTYSN